MNKRKKAPIKRPIEQPILRVAMAMADGRTMHFSCKVIEMSRVETDSFGPLALPVTERILTFRVRPLAEPTFTRPKKR